MVENPLAFESSKTRSICDAFDDAWAFLQGLGCDLTASQSGSAMILIATSTPNERWS